MNSPIYLVGAAGIPNFGDDLIMSLWLEWLAQRQPTTEVWVDCPAPGRAAALMADRHPRVHFVDTLWELCRRAPKDDGASVRAHVLHHISHLGTPELDRGLMIAREAGSIHLVGGGYVNSLWRRNLGLVFAAAHLSREFGVRAYGTGLGLMPQNLADIARVKRDLDAFAVVTVRDAESAELLGIERGEDDVFLNPRRAVSTPGEGHRQIVVLVQGDLVDHLSTDQIHAVIETHISRALGRGLRGITFLEAYPQHDSRLWGELQRRFPEAEYVPFDHLWRHGVEVHPDQEWLTSRFHFHLLGAVGGAKGTALVIDEGYYATKHASLLSAGTGWSVLQMRADAPADALPAPQSNPTFASDVERYHRSKIAQAEALYPSRFALARDAALVRLKSIVRAVVGQRVVGWVRRASSARSVAS